MNYFKLSFVILFLGFLNTLIAQNVNYVDLYNNSDIDNRVLNTSKYAIGSIPHSFDVSELGGAQYSFFFDLPPGTNNVVPQISVGYSSQSGNGIAGYGWHLSGLSAISRTHKNIYFDNKVEPIDYSNSDPFVLDGQRLIPINGQNGANGTEYSTEYETFARIISYGSGITMKFLVTTKDGIEMEYGYTSESRIRNNQNNAVTQWKLNKVTDRFGNYILYIYDNQNIGNGQTQNILREIKYTGNNSQGLQPYNRVLFYYENRTDQNTLYLSNTTYHEKLLLSSVFVLGDDNAVYRRYNLKYAYDDLYSVLNEVEVVSGNGGLLNGTVFKYGEESNSSVRTYSIPSISQGNYDYFIGDFNGDGLSDILACKYTTFPNSQLKLHTEYSVLLKNQSSNTYAQGASGVFPANVTIHNKKSLPDQNNFLLEDFDGDGISDFLAIYSQNLVSNDGNIFRNIVEFKIFKIINDGNSVDFSMSFQPYSGTVGAQNTTYDLLTNDKNVIFGDFDGDSRTDVISILSNGPEFATKISFPGKMSFNQTFFIDNYSNILDFNTFISNEFLGSKYIFAMDMNGDGKDELVVVKGHITRVFSIIRDGYNYRAVLLNALGYPTEWHNIMLADFNGDGKADIFTRNPEGITTIGISNGSFFEERNIVFEIPPIYNSLNELATLLLLVDINGDGKSDIVTHHNVYYSFGDSFMKKPYISPNSSHNRYLISDFDGDGKIELTSIFNGQVGNFNFQNASQKRLLQKVSNGLNEKLEIEYAPLTEGGSFYTKGTNQFTFPVNVIQPALYAVKSVSTSNGIGGMNKKTFAYDELKIHRLGKGILGFANTTVTDLAFQTITTTNRQLNTQFYHNVPNVQLTTLTNNQGVSSTLWQHDFIDLGQKRFYTQASLVQNHDLVNHRILRTDYEYDNFGNVTKETSNNNIETSISTAEYSNVGLAFPVYPTQSNITKTKDGISFSTQTYYNYNNRGALTQKAENVGLPCETKTSYQYNGFGNITSEVLAAEDMPSVTNSYNFDTKGRFIQRKTNSLGQSEYFQYHPNLGEVLEHTDITGLETRYYYDDFGKNTAIIGTGVPQINFKYSWDIQSGQFPSLYKVETTSLGSPKNVVWYDLFGREIKQETEAFQNTNLVFSYQQFDSKGNLFKKSSPFYANTSPLVDTYLYDEYNRLYKVSNIYGATTNDYSADWSTGELTVKTTAPDGTATKKTTDRTGLVIASSDDGGTINFTYNALGNLLKTESDGVVLSLSQYNDCGWQTQLNDNSAGTTTYEYNAYGDLVKQTNALNQSTEIEYDDIGRIIKKTMPEGIINYTYNTQNNKIQRIEDYNGNLETFQYDALNRITRHIKNVDGESVRKNFAYNQLGQLTTETYNTGLTISNLYNSKGFLTQINANNELIYRIDNVNAYGQVTNYSTGNGKQSRIQYTQSVVNRYLTAGVQDLHIDVNMQNGNINKRTDGIKNIIETFTYDTKNRLTNAVTNNGNYSIEMGYSALGNLESKTDVGNYDYHTNKIFAVKQITNPNTTVPNRAQNVTYTSFSQPATILENNLLLTLQYGANENRNKTILKNNSNNQDIYTRYFFGDVEMQVLHQENNKKQTIHYIAGMHGLASIAVKENNGSFNFFYPYTDHLGSILTVTNAQGTIIAEQNFDAWGRERNTQTWAHLPSGGAGGGLSWLYRGYTGHEHLPEFNIINMNGRLYDPLLARFLSPDNYIQSPFNTQSHNRYSYVWNNPMKYNDPDGQWVHIAIGAAIGGVVNLGVKLVQGKVTNFSQGLTAFAVGAVAGGVGAATGGASFAAAGGAAAGAGGFGAGVAGGVMGTAWGSQVLSYGNHFAFGDPLMGTKDFLLGIAIGGVTGGLVNGALASANGKNFWNGNLTADGKNLSALSTAPKSSNNQSSNSKNTSNSINENELLSPHQKGQEGVKKAMQEFESAGGKVLGTEVSFDVNGTRIKIDIVGEFKGKITLIEVKNGSSAGFTPNQKVAFPQIFDGRGVVPVGGNAINANLTEPIPRSSFILMIKKYY